MTFEELSASIVCTRLQPLQPEVVGPLRGVIQAALADGLYLPPLGLVVDLLTMLRTPAPTLVDTAVPGLDLRRWDDRVVSPLLGHRLRPALFEAAHAHKSKWLSVACAVWGDRLGRALEQEGLHWWSGADLRRWLTFSDDDILTHALTSLDDVQQQLNPRLEAMCGGAIASILETDVFTTQHISQMPSPHLRLSASQVFEAAACFATGIPRRVQGRKRQGPQLAQLHDEDLYPAGGFAGVTTSGRPENLVASELVYMEDGPGLDLFDVRYTEGELLYYTRDESIHLRDRREVHWVLHADLVGARVKDPDLAWQRLIALLALVKAVTDQLVRWLGIFDLRVLVHLPKPMLDAEADLLGLMLHPHLQSGVAEMVRWDPDQGIEAPAPKPGTTTEVLWLGCGAEPPAMEVEIKRVTVTDQGLAVDDDGGASVERQWKKTAETLARWLA